MNRITERFLERRGVADVAELASGTPDQKLKDIEVAAAHLRSWKEQGKRVVVLPDFDMDGISAGMLGYAGLSELGFKSGLYEPKPARGYGFDKRDIADIVKEYGDDIAIITCDVGIDCAEGVKAAIDAGVEVVVTDHHMEGDDSPRLKLGVVTVDPCRMDEDYPEPGICGATVMWKVLTEYAEAYERDETVRDAIRRLSVLAGVGTISDLMPMRGENRNIVKDAFALMRLDWQMKDFAQLAASSQPAQCVHAGLGRVLAAFAEAGKVKTLDGVDEGFVGYYLAPAFNSCKRMGEPIRTAYRVFGTDETISEHAAGRLLYINEERKELTAEAYEELVALDKQGLIWESGASAGLLGLLAARKQRETGLPCIVVAEHIGGAYSGSGRSPSWFPFLSRMTGKGAFLAGHEGAFGCKFASFGAMEQFARELSYSVTARYKELEAEGVLAEIGSADVVIDPFGVGYAEADCGSDIALLSEFVSEVSMLAPFGRGFEAPEALVMIPSGHEALHVSTMGSEGQHLKVCADRIEVVMWNAADKVPSIIDPCGATVKLRGRIGFNDWMETRRLQIVADSIEVENDGDRGYDDDEIVMELIDQVYQHGNQFDQFD